MALNTTVSMDGPRNYVVTFVATAGDAATVDVSALVPAATRVGPL